MIQTKYLRGTLFHLKQAEIKAECLKNEIELIKNGDITDFFDEHTSKEVIETIAGLKEHELKLIEEYRDTLRAEISTASLKT